MSEYNMKVEFKQKTFSFLCTQNQDIITSSKKYGIDFFYSCFSEVCTSYASMILDGSVEQANAMGLNDISREKGFSLLSVAYPNSDLHVVIGDQVEDDLFNNQFGKYQE